MIISISTPDYTISATTDLGIAKATITLAKTYDKSPFAYNVDGRFAMVEKRGEMGRVITIKKPATNGPY